MFYGLWISTLGLAGFIYNRKSVFTMLLSLELMLLGMMVEMINKNEMMSENLYMSMMIMMLAGMESLVGLALLVNYYKC